MSQDQYVQYDQVVNSLSPLISIALRMRDNESVSPNRTTDASDYYLNGLKERITKLRQIRQDFEDIMTTSLVERD
jgi:hypothetical protein